MGVFFFSSRRRHTRCGRDWSSDVCSSDLFLGGAQIDRFGNLNTTVIGDYAHPKVRLPGSGGACEIAIHARKILVIMRQATRSFVDRLDFRTSPGHSGDPAHDRARGWSGSGPTCVVTDLGTYGFDQATGEMT